MTVGRLAESRVGETDRVSRIPPVNRVYGKHLSDKSAFRGFGPVFSSVVVRAQKLQCQRRSECGVDFRHHAKNSDDPIDLGVANRGEIVGHDYRVHQ